MLQLDPGMIVWTWITFAVLLLVLRKVAWKPLLGAVEKREKEIGASLRKAEEARTGAERLLAEQQEKLAAAQEEIQQLLKDSKQMADKIRSDTLEQAKQDAQKLLERAKSDIENERQMALTALKKDVAGMVVEATSRLVGVVVDKARHQKIINESIAKFDRKN